jgi:hypothetical protein
LNILFFSRKFLIKKALCGGSGAVIGAASSLLKPEPHQNVSVFEFSTILTELMEPEPEPEPQPQDFSFPKPETVAH